jgi:hypothetical protein
MDDGLGLTATSTAQHQQTAVFISSCVAVCGHFVHSVAFEHDENILHQNVARQAVEE